MNTPETEHLARIKQTLDEGDKEYQAELERQKEIEIMISEGSPVLIANNQEKNEDDLENS